MQTDPATLFQWFRSAGERVSEGSLPWVFGAWLAFTLIALASFWTVGVGFRWLHRRIASLQGTRIRAIRMRGQELFSEQEVTLIILGLLRFVRYGANLLLLYIYLTFVFGLFPATRALASSLFGYFTGAAHALGVRMIDYLPSLAFLIVLIWVTRAVIRLMKMAFDRVDGGRVRLASFPPEFATPTYKIARTLVVFFAIIVAYPYLPGSGSPAFQAVSIFVGLLVSLGSSGAIANVVAGMSLTYMRAFRIGDRVRISDALDDFYVHYELNVHTDAPRRMSITYSLLHAKLQDAFAEAGIEIASPHLAALRDGNQPAMPARYLPDGYLPPAFRVVPSEPMR